MPPLVGLTCCFNPGASHYHLAADYILAVQAAGGEPVILPHTASHNWKYLWGCLDGLLLTGGGDVDPVHFGQEPWPENGGIDPHRDTFELALTARALAEGMPVLGICRGMQILNLAAGGTICQDIGRKLSGAYKHMQEAPRWYPTHAIAIKKESLLGNLLGSTDFRVNSFHHQMVDQIAPGFTVSAQAGDGVVEALEMDHGNGFALGVQFHPENMWEKDPRVLQLFLALVEAAGRFGMGKK